MTAVALPDRRTAYWLLASVLLVLAPHAAYQPWWLSAGIASAPGGDIDGIVTALGAATMPSFGPSGAPRGGPPELPTVPERPRGSGR